MSWFKNDREVDNDDKGVGGNDREVDTDSSASPATEGAETFKGVVDEGGSIIESIFDGIFGGGKKK